MRYKLPKEANINKLNRLIKRLFKEKFFNFVSNIQQKIFYISNDQISAIVVVDSLREEIEVFQNSDALLTCHSLFSGDEKSLDLYGYNHLFLGYIDQENVAYDNFAKYHEKYRFIKKDDNIFTYLTYETGQYPIIINDEDSLLLIDVIQYLLEIKRLFYDGEEVMPETDEDCVLCFEFDDYELQYNSSIIALSSFDFLPNMTFNTRRNTHYIDKLKAFNLNAGTLYLSQMYLPIVADYVNCQNGVKIPLNEILLYAATDTGVFEYVLYSTLKQDGKKALKNSLLSIFENIGLYDLVETDNYILYLAIVEDFKAINIEVKFNPFNRFNSFIYSSLKNFTEYHFEEDFVKEVIETFKLTYPTIAYDIDASELFDEEEEEDLEEDVDNDSNYVS